MTEPSSDPKPKSATISNIVGVLFIVGIASAAVTSCANDLVERKELEETAPPARFEVLESFRMFDKDHPANGDNGFIIRDRKHPDRCFLKYNFGSGNGGAGLTRVPCDDDADKSE